jgi:hypothetical protein
MMFRQRPASSADSPGDIPVLATVALFQLFPFLAALAAATGQPAWPPPEGTMSYQAEDQSWVVRVPGQPPDLKTFWYEPNEGGRHHTLQVCLQYRGHPPRPGPEPEVLSYEGEWLTEFFLMPGGHLLDYRQYLRATFWPYSSSGVHLIFSVPQQSMTAGEFRSMAKTYALRLAALEGGGENQVLEELK